MSARRFVLNAGWVLCLSSWIALFYWLPTSDRAAADVTVLCSAAAVCCFRFAPTHEKETPCVSRSSPCSSCS